MLLSYSFLGKNLYNHGPNRGPNHGAAGSLEEEETPPESARKLPCTAARTRKRVDTRRKSPVFEENWKKIRDPVERIRQIDALERLQIAGSHRKVSQTFTGKSSKVFVKTQRLTLKSSQS